MIPKIVYYCWFGDQMPLAIKQRITQWKEVLHDYQFIEINEQNFDYTQYQFTQDAYAAKKFAYVSDVARLEFLNATGGVYLDTDVDVKQSLNRFLQSEILHLSMEYYGYEITGVNVGTIICPANHRVIKRVKELIVHSNYHAQRPPINVYFNQVLSQLVYKNKEQYFAEQKTIVYQCQIFCKRAKESVTIHHYDHSWGQQLTWKQKGKRLVGLAVKKCIGRKRFDKMMRKGKIDEKTNT